MWEKIKLDLADNFRDGDDNILQDYIDRVTADALSISNREDTEENKNLLESEIIQCVEGLYLQRGSEGNKSLNASGVSSTFTNCLEDLRLNIVKAGKRVPFVWN